MNEELFPMSEAIREAYRRGEDEEGMSPLVLVDGQQGPIGRIGPGDYVIFYDIRGEREIELTRSFTQKGFDRFSVDPHLTTHWVTMIQYHPDLPVRVAFPPYDRLENTLSELISRAGLRQLKIAETEKALHVTYFLNGKRESPFPGEERIIVPSPKDISNFDQCPHMSCAEVADRVIDRIRDGHEEFICVNLANIDVVGHIENRPAILEAIRVVDRQVGRIVGEARDAGVFTLLVADHGTVEKWYYPDGKIDTGHTDSPVPFVAIPPEGVENVPMTEGETSLIDVAPTILHLLGLPVPDAMTGRSLIADALQQACGRRVLLLIMDGWGYNPSSEGNLIAEAETPYVDGLMAQHPWRLLAASGEAVGLPSGTVGNSESGHLHLGTGRMVASDRIRIARAIEEGTFQKNPEFLWAIRQAKEQGTGLHLLGIVSFYSSHGSIEYLYALMDMAKKEGLERVFIHSLLGRRGERPESGAYYVRQIEERAHTVAAGRVVSVIGRYWALDREHNWDRIQR
ncbi:MAG: phosphoglycerate mutase (2,3-diphosphoglycerate-independent), partial [bacterium]